MWLFAPFLAFAGSSIEVVSFSPDAAYARLSVVEEEQDPEGGMDGPIITRVTRTEWWQTYPWTRVAYDETRADIDPETGEVTLTPSSEEGDKDKWYADSAGWTKEPPYRLTDPGMGNDHTWSIDARVDPTEWPLPTTVEPDTAGFSWTVGATGGAIVTDAAGEEVDPETVYVSTVDLWLVGPTETLLTYFEGSERPPMYGRTGRVDVYFDPAEAWVLFVVRKGGAWMEPTASVEWYRVPLAIDVVKTPTARPEAVESVVASLVGGGYRVTRSESGNVHEKSQVFVRAGLRRIGEELEVIVPGGASVEDLTWESPADVVFVVGTTPAPTPAPASPVPQPAPTPLTVDPVPAPESDGTCLCSATAIPFVGLFWLVVPLIRRRSEATARER